MSRRGFFPAAAPWPPPTLLSPPPLPPPSPSTSNGDNNAFASECSQGFCTPNCPQWCGGYFFLPPPPAPDDSSSRISPLMAALIAVLSAAFLLPLYYTLFSRFCRRRRNHHPNLHLHSSIHDSSSSAAPTNNYPRPAGLDDSFIRQITVFKYRRADRLVDGTECVVCLSEFKEEEELRLMPNCEHAFHIPCIDTWLRNNSNCPLCRKPMNPDPPNRPGGPNSTGPTVAALRVQRTSGDAVLEVVVREDQGEVIVCHQTDTPQVEERDREDQVRKADS